MDLTPDAAAQAARHAVEVVRAAAMNIGPLDVPSADKISLLARWSRQLLGHEAISHVDASLVQVRECKFYSDGATTTAAQQRVWGQPGYPCASSPPVP